MGNLFGDGGGNKGASPTTGLQIPPFTASGGITPDEQAFADYTYGQNLLGQANAFGTEGLGDSTMATQGAEGAEMGKAKQLGEISDINQGAQYGVYENQVTDIGNLLSSQAALASSSGDVELAQLAAQLFASNKNPFGGSQLTGSSEGPPVTTGPSGGTTGPSGGTPGMGVPAPVVPGGGFGFFGPAPGA